MLFVLNRDLVVWADDGTHCIAFKKGEPVKVPSKMKTKVLSLGAEAADDDTKTAVDKVEESEQTGAPVDPEERKEALVSVLEAVLAENNNKHFTATGRPKVAVVINKVGFETTSKELEPLWDEIMAAQGGEEG